MAFYKSFPTQSKFPTWEEILLTINEEKEQEERAKKENKELFMECMKQASEIIKKANLKPYQTDIISISRSLFEKLSSHVVFYKENACKRKFEAKKELFFKSKQI